MVAGQAEGVTGRHHAHHQAEHAGGVGAAVDEVAEEDRPASEGRYGVDRSSAVVAHQLVAEVGEQGLQLRPAAVHVADRVEGAVLVAAVVEERLAHDGGGLDLLDAVQHVDAAEALLGQVAQGLVQLRDCRLTTPAPKSRSGRAAFLSMATPSGTSSTIATGSRSCSLARARRWRRAFGWTLVASTTVRRPRASRLPTM